MAASKNSACTHRKIAVHNKRKKCDITEKEVMLCKIFVLLQTKNMNEETQKTRVFTSARLMKRPLSAK